MPARNDFPHDNYDAQNNKGGSENQDFTGGN
jgi:hypothetical protein